MVAYFEPQIETQDNLEEFINEAIQADGRGHFLNTYDSNENEEKTEDGEYLYIYKIYTY